MPTLEAVRLAYASQPSTKSTSSFASSGSTADFAKGTMGNVKTTDTDEENTTYRQTSGTNLTLTLTAQWSGGGALFSNLRDYAGNYSWTISPASGGSGTVNSQSGKTASITVGTAFGDYVVTCTYNDGVNSSSSKSFTITTEA